MWDVKFFFPLSRALLDFNCKYWWAKAAVSMYLELRNK